MPKGMICDLEDLQLSDENPSEEALQNRENYAKVASILFYPFWDNSVFSLQEDGCLWEKMTRLMTMETPQNYFFREGKKTPKYPRQHASKEMKNSNRIIEEMYSFHTK